VYIHLSFAITHTQAAEPKLIRDQPIHTVKVSISHHSNHIEIFDFKTALITGILSIIAENIHIEIFQKFTQTVS
jgi:hypothetical protein